MKRKTLLLALLGMAGILAGCKSSGDYAVYYNGKVYTADKAKPDATAFVVENGKFIYVGDDRGALKYGKGTDLNGKRVIPGVIDSHCHPVFTSVQTSFATITLPKDANLEETLAALEKEGNDDNHKNLPMILGLGFSSNCRPVRAADLDKIFPDRPAVIFSDDIHALWINTKAMEMAKLTKDTPDPIPGASYFERDANGNPTGFVVETTAGFNLLRNMGVFTPEILKRGLPDIMEIFAENGITTVFDAGFCAVNEPAGLQALRELENENKLTMRFHTSYFYFGPPVDNPDNMLNNMLANQKKFTSELVKADTLKMIADGTLEVQTAWMKDDYLPPAKGRGGALIRLKDMLPAARLAAEHGFNIHDHAIGDAAISEALDLHEQLGKIKGTKTICHLQVMPRDGVERFIKQGDIFFQTTPCWLMADKYTEDVLGRERYLRQVPLASAIKGGVTVTFGSDFPASDGPAGLNIFFNMWVAVNRDHDETIAPPKSEAITVKDCIDAYTINGAKQLGAEDIIGSITVGKSADFAVCSDDLLTINPEKLNDVTIEKTFFRGKCVFEKTK